jgi:CelD/BcsL family acetyltransferase involved in cellulose biosynthesis
MEALDLGTELAVEEINDRAGFAALQPEWDALVRATRDEPFFRHDFFRVWLDNFAPASRLRVLVARDGSGALAAALPLVEQRGSVYGIPMRELCAAANAHSCRFDVIARDGDAAARAFLSHLSGDTSWDVLKLTDVPDGGNGWRLLEAARSIGAPTGTWTALESPWMPLAPSWEEQAAGLQSKFKANCRRRRRKLEERGKVSFERYTGEGGDLLLDAKLEEGFALEASGWKGENGTAMAQDPATRGFYCELARAARGQGWLALSFLRLDGRPVAFHYALRAGGTYLLLKPGYDEALKECSPGQLLMEDVLQDCIGSGFLEFDFLGPDMTWKRDWTGLTRRHTWLFVFRDTTFGRAVRSAKFRWVPAAKERVAKWKR